MAASQNNLSLVINQQDSNGVNILNRQIGAIGYAGAVGQFTDGLLTTTGATALAFPIGLTNAGQFYFKNTHASANITINLTPTSATGSVIVAKLTPGSAMCVWQAASGSSGAFTAATGTSDTTNATCEFFIGG